MSEVDPLVDLLESELAMYGGEPTDHVFGAEKSYSSRNTGEPTNQLVFKRVNGRLTAKFIDLASGQEI